MRLGERAGTGRTIIIDGGLSTALEEAGHDLSDPLWTARLLLDDPEALVAAHAAYVAAGADVVISGSYQATIEGLVERGLERPAAEAILGSSTRVARTGAGDATVLASIGPYGAAVADGSEYTGDYDLDESGLLQWHTERLRLLMASQPDGLAVETIPSVSETRALAALIGDSEVEVWFSFTCGPDALLRSGEDVGAAVEEVAGVSGLVAVGVNCTAPADVAPALIRIGEVAPPPFVVYPNLGRAWDPIQKRWEGDQGENLDHRKVQEWIGLGARFIGGCCGSGPADIRRLRQMVDELEGRVS